MMSSKRFIQLLLFVVVAYKSFKKLPCHRCGCGVSELGSRNLYSHLRYCKEMEGKDHSNNNTGGTETSDKTTDPYACTNRGVLESILNAELDSFKSNDENEEGWELHENCGPSEGSVEEGETHVISSKKWKHHFMKSITISGNVVFQVELMEILQRHKTDMNLHDKIIHFLDHYLMTGKLNLTDPNFSPRK